MTCPPIHRRWSDSRASLGFPSLRPPNFRQSKPYYLRSRNISIYVSHPCSSPNRSRTCVSGALFLPPVTHVISKVKKSHISGPSLISVGTRRTPSPTEGKVVWEPILWLQLAVPALFYDVLMGGKYFVSFIDFQRGKYLKWVM